MTAINRLICAAFMASVLITSGCASISSSKPLTIPGIDTSSVLILENDDGRTAVLTGKVSKGVDRIAVEDYVRTEFDYAKIVNNISIE